MIHGDDGHRLHLDAGTRSDELRAQTGQLPDPADEVHVPGCVALAAALGRQ